MEPDPSTPSRQGSGNKRADKTGKTVSPDQIPPDLRTIEGVDEGLTEGANPAGATAPALRHTSRAARNQEGGSFRGRTKRGEGPTR